MRVSALLLVSLFCKGHAFLEGSPDSRGVMGLAPAAPPECPGAGVHHLPDPNSCNGYYSCVEGVRSYRMCPDGLLYNHATTPDGDPCDDPANTTCFTLDPPTQPSPPPVCVGGDQRHLPDPADCSAFYECRWGAAFPRKCPEELLYNAFSPPTRFPCDYPDNVNCSAAPPPPPPPTRGPFHPQRPQEREPNEPKKVYNFYTYVTNNW